MSGRWVIVSNGCNIIDPGERPGFKKHAAMQTGVPPMVLVLDPGRVAIPDNHDVDAVAASYERAADIKL